MTIDISSPNVVNHIQLQSIEDLWFQYSILVCSILENPIDLLYVSGEDCCHRARIINSLLCQDIGRKHPMSCPASLSNSKLTVVRCLESPQNFQSDAFHLINKLATQLTLQCFVVQQQLSDNYKQLMNLNWLPQQRRRNALRIEYTSFFALLPYCIYKTTK